MAEKIPREILMAIYPPVGELVVTWAMTEQMLDHWVTIFFQASGGERLITELPAGLKRKMKFLRRSLRELPALAPFKDEGLALLSEVAGIADYRHTVVHGALAKYDARSETITFVKLKAVKDKHWIQPRTMKGNDLLNIGSVALDFCSRLGDFTKRLVDAFVPQDVLDKHRGNL